MNPPTPEPLITLSSDFGTRDGYAGAMKGVIRSVAPGVRLEDITHEIPPGDIRSGAWVLRTAVPFFPRGTVHVVVVDPGVGTSRNAVVLQADHQYLIGPDNGVFSWIIREASFCRAWKLSDDSWHPAQTSHTFHGRDLFAHAAALMVQEGELDRVCGEEVTPRCEEWAKWVPVSPGNEAEVVHIDAFGNVVTNLCLTEPLKEFSGPVSVPERGLVFSTLNRTYGEVAEGEGLLLIGSHGFLEIAVRQGSAAQRFGLKRGDRVTVGAAP
ncbi:MAG: SAM hydrolase/SAM-dependent halogenase family protein [Kiritimatiellia bacterium]